MAAPKARREYRPKPDDEVRRNMSAIRSSENRTESALRRSVHALGLRYRKYRSDLPGRPDFVFPTERVAVFVDGDYWHCRILVEHGVKALEATLRTRHRDYWRTKFQRRVARDQQVTAELKQAGWKVVRLWESDVQRDIGRAARAIARAVLKRRTRLFGLRHSRKL